MGVVVLNCVCVLCGPRVGVGGVRAAGEGVPTRKRKKKLGAGASE